MLKSQIKWANKTAVITGSGSGIGRAVAIALAEKGTTVHLVDCRQERITSLLEELSPEAGDCRTCDRTNTVSPTKARSVHAHTIDVTKPEQLQQLAASIQGRVDILINCAGILHQGKIATAPHQELHRVIDVNLWGAIYIIKALLPLMRSPQESHPSRKSHIINIASIAGLIGAPEVAIYNASKAAILSLTESLSIELASDNIHVAAVCPGSVKTNLDKDGQFSSESTAAQIVRSSIRGGALPEKVAQDIVQVIESSSSFRLSRVELYWQMLWLCKRIFPAQYPKLARTIYHSFLKREFVNSFLSARNAAKQCL